MRAVAENGTPTNSHLKDLGCAAGPSASSSAGAGRRPSQTKATRGPYKILIVNDYSPEETHGISVHLLHLVTRLRKRGHKVVHFTTRNSQGVTDNYVMPAVTNPYNKGNKMALFPGCKFFKVLYSEDWDLVHLVYPTCMAWIVLAAASLRQIPTYCSHHVDLNFLNKAYNTGCGGRIISPFLSCLSECYMYAPTGLMGTAQAGPTYTAMWKEKPRWCRGYMDRIPTSIDDRLFFSVPASQRLEERRRLCEACNISMSDIIVLQVGRIAPEKGQEEVLNVLALLVKQEQSSPIPRTWKVVLVGDGPYRPTLERLVDELQLRDHVVFLGMRPNEEIPYMYRGADCFVTCTRSESFGITVLEAIACGCPVVMPRLDVFEELYSEHIPDCMYIQDCPESMAAAIQAAAEDDARERLASAKAWSGIFLSWEDAVTDQERQYAAMITEYKSSKCCGPIGPRGKPRSLVHSARVPYKDRKGTVSSFEVDQGRLSDYSKSMLMEMERVQRERK
eukprot:TRINITY_DN5917_c0_g2_i1.p1 TRINITY_DN5917_c0_g2~~TRINITY_DN5917_c0_g2_i1.p1  ORF type:complete len:505 (-),score=82.95 TRINITY_DN5917_c0_g2_i1:265-1779(-)